MGRAPIKALPSKEELDSLLSYNPDTGELRWKRKTETCRADICFNNKCADRPAGTICHRGYLVVGIRKPGANSPTYYLAHRLIWKMMTGRDPEDQVDHIDTDRLNNRWGNLRPASNGQNIQNARLRVDNRSGVKGVSWDNYHKKWQAVISQNKRHVRLGRFECLDDAAAAMAAARGRLHGEFARIG